MNIREYECPLCKGEGKALWQDISDYEEAMEYIDHVCRGEEFDELEYDHEKLCLKVIHLVDIIKDLDTEYLAELELKMKLEGKWDPRLSRLRQKLSEVSDDALYLT